jgi:hypothetical protein
MTGAQMATAGLALYGVNWKSALARKLGIASSVVGRWATGVGLPVKVTSQTTVAKKLKTTW